MLDKLKHCMCIDVETTGVNPDKNSIVSIGATPVKNKSEFYIENCLRDNVEFNKTALSINGFSKQDLLQRKYPNYPNEIEALDKLIDFCEDNNSYVVAGFNPRFDYGFLLSIWIRNGRSERSFPLSHRLIDLGSLGLAILLKQGVNIPKTGLSSGFIQNSLGLEKEPSPHNALTGAKYNLMYIEKILSQL